MEIVPMEWDELNAGVVNLPQDEEAPAESEIDNPETDEATQESSDSVDDAPEDISSTSPSEDDTETAITEESETEFEEDFPPSDVVTISGNAIILPEGYDFTSFSSLSSTENEDAVVQAIEEQTSYVCGGFAIVSFLLGMVIGCVCVQGFRLRRV